MHILLTDVLSCPRCGPAHGLILLADRIAERRVLEGILGCPNCRARYAIAGGFADLRRPIDEAAAQDAAAAEAAVPGPDRAPPTPEEGPLAAAAGDAAREGAREPAPAPRPGGEAAALRLAALLGLSPGRAIVLLDGGNGAFAPGLAALVEGVEAVTTDPALRAWPEAAGVSRLALPAGALPFTDRSLAGAALRGGEAAAREIADVARAIAPLGRLVLEGASAADAAAVDAADLDVVASEETPGGATIVAARSRVA